MRYLTVAPNYTGPCIYDDFDGVLYYGGLELDEELCHELSAWNIEYREIIPLSSEERIQRQDVIDELDRRGILLARRLADAIPGGAKVSYYSEGKMRLLVLGSIPMAHG